MNKTVTISSDGGSQIISGTVIGIDNTVNQIPENKQSIYELSEEIEQLLNHLSQANSINTPQDKALVTAQAVEHIEGNPKLKARIINALQAGAMEGLKKAIPNPLGDVLMATISGWKTSVE